MDRKSPSSSSHRKTSLFRNLVMPGFTDAGAGTAYVPSATISRRTTSASSSFAKNSAEDNKNPKQQLQLQQQQQQHDADSDNEDTFSEAATELHDNRTKQSSDRSTAARLERYYHLNSAVVRDSRTIGEGGARESSSSTGGLPNRNMAGGDENKSNSINNDNACDEGIEVEATYGFFPLTKPPPSPSPRRMVRPFENISQEAGVATPGSGSGAPMVAAPSSSSSPSPRPLSPPPVTRKQLVQRSSSATAVVDDALPVRPSGVGKRGDGSASAQRTETPSKNENENENENSGEPSPRSDQKHPFEARDQHLLPMRPVRFQLELKREVSTFSLAPETGAVLDREEHRDTLKRWKEHGATDPTIANQFPAVNEEDAVARVSPKPSPVADASNDDAKEGTDSPRPRDAEDTVKDHTDDNDNNNDNDNYIETQTNENNTHRRLDLTALQEMEEQQGIDIDVANSKNNGLNAFMQREKESKFRSRPFQLKTEPSADLKNAAAKEENSQDKDEELSVSSSIVSSTCSNFGTVIEMGQATLTQRMAEVDEMEKAALGQEGTQYSEGNLPPQLSSSCLLEHDSSLDLPILEESSSDRTGSNAATATGGTKEDRYANHISETKTTVATANSTVTSPTKRNPAKSEMVSAVCRRMGNMHGLSGSVRGGNRTNNPRSAPTTPKKPAFQARSSESSQKQAEGRHLSGTEHDSAEIKSKPSGGKAPPSSFLLRSPGSLARFSFAAYQSEAKKRGSESNQNQVNHSGNQKLNILNPRFATLGLGKGRGESSPRSSGIAITKTLQRAQKCFSFDNTADGHTYGLQDYDPDDDIRNNYDPESRLREIREELAIPPLGQQSATAQLTPRVLPLESSSRMGGNQRGSRQVLGPRKQSRSFDASSIGRSPFRTSASSTTRGYPSSQRSSLAPIHDVDASAAPGVSNSAFLNYRRNRSHSDVFPTQNPKSRIASHSEMELKQPQRIEIEREDALDILALLVNQGLADWETPTTSSPDPHSHTNATMHTSSNTKSQKDDSDHGEAQSSSSSPAATRDLMTTAKEEKTDDHNSQVSTESVQEVKQNDLVRNDSRDNDSILQGLIQNFKEWSEEHADNPNNENDISKQHEHHRQVELLEELVRSHSYAKEMKRASTSASAWLKSIGRGETAVSNEITDDNKESPDSNSTSISKVSTEQSDSNNQNRGSKIDKMDLLTLNATLRSTQLELAAFKRTNAMLNEELSECRAEIGRMRSLSRSELNKSVLDDSERSSESSASKEPSIKSVAFDEPHVKEQGKPENTYERLFRGVSEKEAKERIESAAELDVLVLKNALEKANETIQTLHNELHKNDANDNTTESKAVPLVDIPDIQVNKTEFQSTPSTPDSLHRTVNVQMLDAENFVTDWYDLKTLPPPPDHDLQSPIVATVLQQWTQDPSLHQSLLSWIENVMRGDDLEDLRPLTISSLDHQVRDGFSMHVLSQLLRRADIHVAVQQRAHRNTTYDMSVTVNQKKEFTSSSFPAGLKSQPQPSLLDTGDSMSEDEWAIRFEPNMSSTESVAHSAVTETISNLPSATRTRQGGANDPWTRAPETPKSEYSSFPSRLRSYSGGADTFDENSQHYRQRYNENSNNGAANGTIMGALGGAISGLLSRNKYAASPGKLQQPQTQYYSAGSKNDGRDSSNMLPASLRAQMDLTSSPTSGSARYHRAGNPDTISSSVLDNHHQEHDEPFRRVVNAPPGRIGVTFVDYRGHATVSDVAMDSPLNGWVHPSDVLIAIDDIPVTGMPVRDIVQILANRSDQYRAMRVISSHAMNEFTLRSQLGGPLMEETHEEN